MRPPAAAGLPCSARQPDLSVGAVVYVKGEASLNGDVPLERRASLRHGDQIETANDGFVAIELHDGNLVRIGPSSTVITQCNTASSEAVNSAADEEPYDIMGAYMSGGIRG